MNKEFFVNAMEHIETFCHRTEELSEQTNSGINLINIPEVLECVSDLIAALQIAMCDTNEDISYFMFEINFGKDYKEGCVTDEYGNNVDFSNAGALYDFLEMRMDNMAALADEEPDKPLN